MSLGSEVKSLTGTGIFFTMYSQTTSMLYFSCAEMGMMGAPSATVPAGDASTSGGRPGERPVQVRRNTTLTLHEGQDLLVLLFGLTLLHQVDLVLQDEDVLQLHDLDGCQVLGRLRLRARLVPRWQAQTEKSGISQNNRR